MTFLVKSDVIELVKRSSEVVGFLLYDLLEPRYF